MMGIILVDNTSTKKFKQFCKYNIKYVRSILEQRQNSFNFQFITLAKHQVSVNL